MCKGSLIEKNIMLLVRVVLFNGGCGVACSRIVKEADISAAVSKANT